ncbi:hypothetical protein [Paracoccus marinaquae]|uniref:Uncharacterized protein n=1 Tax=Paracoccus marinaquae TaxID=2841926 RepID=A0ABS6AM46_9RHOB|nr:hypothetical protein [Paracoccus marinaquae]MBU3031649.1 hypothetical protein [Paracoccus marinaquae]
MIKSDATSLLPKDMRQQLLALEQAGLLNAAERREVGVALLQRLADPAIPFNSWLGNKNAPPIAQRGM